MQNLRSIIAPSNKSERVNRRLTAQKLLEVELEKLPTDERIIVERFISRGRIARNIQREFDAQLTFGEKMADRVAAIGGSWSFIIGFMIFLIGWMALNVVILMQHAFDPYPFILLNLVLSSIAALQAPVIMMSQNRQGEIDRMQAQHDYEVNIKAELEILQLHEKINELREGDWTKLITMQHQQIEMMQKTLDEMKVMSRK
jgi:uncharacterized membrane protein